METIHHEPVIEEGVEYRSHTVVDDRGMILTTRVFLYDAETGKRIVWNPNKNNDLASQYNQSLSIAP